MIEVIYDSEEEISRQTGKIKFPKNIRQIGEPPINKKIYIEDYVITFVNQLAKPSSLYSRGAILLGECKKTDGMQAIFISGAIEAQNLELDLDETVFTNETWTEIYEKVKKYFPDLEVVGWFLSRLGFSTEINDKITKTHIDNFPGKDKVLYVIDSLEHEDLFYMYEKGELAKQNGYYIYYERNEAMQNYIINTRVTEEPRNIDEIESKDADVVKRYKEKLNYSKEEYSPAKQINILYVASSLLVIAVLAIGITILNNYSRMKEIEVSLNRMSLSVTDNKSLDNDQSQTDIKTVNANVQPTETTGDTEGDKAESTTEDTAAHTSETTQQEVTEDVAADPLNDALPNYYTVEAGDTLISISRKMYNSDAYVENIMNANEMTEEKIEEGQKIVIPTVN